MKTIEQKKYLIFNEVFLPVPIAMMVGVANFFAVIYGAEVHSVVGLLASAVIWGFMTLAISHLVWKNIRRWHEEYKEEKDSLVFAYEDLRKRHRDLSADHLLLQMALHRDPPFKQVDFNSVKGNWREGLQMLAQRVCDAEMTLRKINDLSERAGITAGSPFAEKSLFRAQEHFEIARDFLKNLVCIPEVQKINTWEDAMEL